jgi:hypothetical protein
MTIFGAFFSATLLMAIGLGAGVGFYAVSAGDPMLAWVSGGLFTYPFAFLVGSANGRNDERQKSAVQL